MIWIADPSLLQIAIREAKRQNPTYRQHSIKALGRVARARKDLDTSDSVFDAVGSVMSSHDDEDAMEVDGDRQSPRADAV